MPAARLSSARLNLFGAALAALLPSVSLSQQPLSTVSSVDLHRYIGRWYEIARYPNRFEKKCDRDVTATYAVRPDGKISVVNTCTTAAGKVTTAKGWARVVDSATNARLKVTFFWPFFGNYWIIDLDPSYQYAVVGEPSRQYLWILSRTPRIDDKLYGEILSRIARQGYDPGRIERTRQTQ